MAKVSVLFLPNFYLQLRRVYELIPGQEESHTPSDRYHTNYNR